MDTSLDFFEKVVPFGLNCVLNFLNGDSLPSTNPFIISEDTFITNNELYDENYAIKSNRIHLCKTCQMEIQGEKSWNAHLQSRKHQKMKHLRKKEEVLWLEKSSLNVDKPKEIL